MRVVVSRRRKGKGDPGGPRLPENLVKQPELLTKIQMSAQEASLDQMSDAEIDAEIAAYRSQHDKESNSTRH